MSEDGAYGPIDTLVLEFPSSAGGAETARELADLVDRGIIRLYDLVVVRKGTDGTCEEFSPSPESPLAALGAFAGARSGLVGAEDLEAVSGILEPGTVAVVVVYENAWAAPFVSAARGEGAEVVAGVRISAQEIMDALDAVEAIS